MVISKHADPDQTRHDAVSDQDLHCLLTDYSTAAPMEVELLGHKCLW